MKLAVLASGKGTNFKAIVFAAKEGTLDNVEVDLLITDKEYAPVRGYARTYGVREIFVDPEEFSLRDDFDRELIKIIKNGNIDMVVLAGYMRILSSCFVKAFENRIINIHPALLPSFKGTNAIKRAYNYGVKITGVTVHFVDEEVDHGPIIMQGEVIIKEGETFEELERRIHCLEHNLYPRAIKLLATGKLRVKGRQVTVLT